MLRIRTKLLLASLVPLGLGIGVLSSLADGFYSAICLFFLPLGVALAGVSIIADFSQPSQEENVERTVVHENRNIFHLSSRSITGSRMVNS